MQDWNFQMDATRTVLIVLVVISFIWLLSLASPIWSEKRNNSPHVFGYGRPKEMQSDTKNATLGTNRQEHLAVPPQNAHIFSPIQQMMTTKVLQYDRFQKLTYHLKVKPALHQSNYKTRDQVVEHLGYDPREQVKEFNHTIQYWHEDKFIILEVAEFHNANFSTGGSSFHAVVQSPTVLQACGYEDYFNGSYRIQCAVYSACVNVKVTVLHLSLRQFYGVTTRQDITVLSKQICVTSNEVQMTPSTDVWGKDKDDKWTWHTDDMDYPIRNKTQFCAYVETMTRDKFYMVGASHMEFQHAYILNRCLKYTKKLNKRFHYVKARFGTDVIATVHKLAAGKIDKKCLKSGDIAPLHCKELPPKVNIKSNTADKKIIPASVSPQKDCDNYGRTGIGMMIQAGSWDLVYKGLNYSLYSLMPKFDDAFRQFQTFLKANPSVNFLVMGPPTIHPEGVYAQTRNNDMVQLFNQAFQRVAEQNDMTYVNVFDMMYPRFEKVTPNNHYIECKHGKCKGDVGIVAVELAVKQLVTSCD